MFNSGIGGYAMKTKVLRAMIKRTVKEYGDKVREEDIDYILDLCDDNYEEELAKVMEAQRRINEVFILALGRQKFNEIKDQQNESQ